MPVDCGIAGTAYRMRSVINVANVNDDPRFYAEVDRSTGFRTQSLLCIPLIGHDAEAIGVLE